MNSGTSMNMVAAMASLSKEKVRLTGDESLRSRPFEPIAKALNELGAKANCLGKDGRPPIEVEGILQGGITEINGLNSQPVSSLLINCACAEQDSSIKVKGLCEKPYVEMTMNWLDEQGINYRVNGDMSRFEVKGGQEYKAFEKEIPADFSSAAFPLCAAAICKGSNVLLKGLDLNDCQGDKAIVGMLRQMGADIRVEEQGIRAIGSELHGTELDLNDTPDLLPIVAVVGCFAEGETSIVNCAQARIKETDRIKAMAAELRKMGAKVEERPDGMSIKKSELNGTELLGHQDHRIVMALAVAGLKAEGITSVGSAEATAVTFPGFVEKMKSLGAEMQ